MTFHTLRKRLQCLSIFPDLASEFATISIDETSRTKKYVDYFKQVHKIDK